MLRGFAIALVLSCLATAGLAQAQPEPAAQSPAPETKSAPKRPAAKPKAVAKSASADTGPCRIGVIPFFGNKFAVQTRGFTIFSNEDAEIPLDPAWGLDDVAVARIRAIAGQGVQRISYPRDAFVPFENAGLFSNWQGSLTDIVRKITANANCQQYIVVTKQTKSMVIRKEHRESIGVVRAKGVVFSDATLIFANIEIVIFDGQSLAILRSPPVIANRMTKTDFGLIREIDNASFPATPAEATRSIPLREGTRALIAEIIDETMLMMVRTEQN